MIPERAVWVFSTAKGCFPGGNFTTVDRADEWIVANRLTGTLTADPLEQGAFDWALSQGVTNLRAELLEQRRHDPAFIGGFSTASQEHFHYEDGRRA